MKRVVLEGLVRRAVRKVLMEEINGGVGDMDEPRMTTGELYDIIIDTMRMGAENPGWFFERMGRDEARLYNDGGVYLSVFCNDDCVNMDYGVKSGASERAVNELERAKRWIMGNIGTCGNVHNVGKGCIIWPR